MSLQFVRDTHRCVHAFIASFPNYREILKPKTAKKTSQIYFDQVPAENSWGFDPAEFKQSVHILN